MADKNKKLFEKAEKKEVKKVVLKKDKHSEGKSYKSHADYDPA